MHVSDGRDFILLYGDETQTPNMDGGLYFNLNTNLVYWARVRDDDLPPDNQWVSLRFALEKALHMWEWGKFYLGEPEYSLSYRAATVPCYKTWVASDLETAIRSWDRLLVAIQERLPVLKGTISLPLLEPLTTAVPERFDLSSFAKAFLNAAKRPSFTYIALGITTFTP